MSDILNRVGASALPPSAQGVAQIGGGFGGPEREDLVAAKVAQEKEYRVSQAFQTLHAAWKFKQDKDLMADLREWLKRQTKDLALFLDDVGSV